MKQANSFKNHDFIKFQDLNILPDVKIVILYASLMNNDDRSWTLDSHAHSFYELHIPLKGSCDIVFQNLEHIRLDEGKYVLISPNATHCLTNCSNDFFRLSIAFDIQYEDRLIPQESSYLIDNSTEIVNLLIGQIALEYSSRNIGYKKIIHSHIETILIEFLRTNSSLLQTNKRTRNTSHAKLHNALKFIKNNASYGINVNDVARHINLSSRQLNRIFVSTLNITISEYIRKEKILHVQEYLSKTALTLAEIAQLTGFADAYALCRTFKKVTGLTPGTYRSNHPDAKS